MESHGEIFYHIHFHYWKKDCNNIIAGDFNHEYKKKCKLYNTPGFETHNLCPTYYIERKMNIDNILTKGFQKAPLSKCNWYPTRVEDGFKEYGSDHLPVFVEVEWLIDMLFMNGLADWYSK